MNLGAVLLTGLFAGGISCATVQGGLLTGMVTRQREAAPVPGNRNAVKPRPGGKSRGATPPKAAPTRSQHPKKKQADWQSQGRVTTMEPPAPLHVRMQRSVTAARATAADDLAPVGGFLAGKLLSHTVLGLLLGALGAVVQLSAGMRATAQILAGILIVVFGLAQLGVRGFKNIRIEAPRAFTRFVRGRARSQSAIAPAILGFFTVLIPCGVTLSVEALALTSGSVWAGAATMAVFVVGTSPLFAVLGYAARKAATAWQGKLALATGMVVLAMGAYTLNGGLTLIDSPFAATNLAQTLGFTAGPASADTVTVASGRQTAVMTARTGSYSPGNIQVVAGVPTTLIVHSDDVSGCVRSLVIRDKQYILPENGDTPIDLGVLQPGELRYRCGMGMYTGKLTIVAATAATQGATPK
jgi:sulfite exporter TauE/SafE